MNKSMLKLKQLFSVIVIIICCIFLFKIINNKVIVSNDKKMSYNDFINKAENNEIERVDIDLTAITFVAYTKDGQLYEVDNPKSVNFKEQLLKYNIDVEEKVDSNFPFGLIISLLIPFIPMIAFLLYAQKKASPIMKTKSYNVITHSDVKMSDVVGLKEITSDINAIIDMIKNPKLYKERGAEIPKGMILYGPPGTGKTLIAKAIAGEAQLPYLYASGSDFVELFVGNGAKKMRALMDEAKKQAPCIVFIDEIDTLGKTRGMGGNSNDEREQTLNELLTQMDGFNSSQGIFFIGATNRIDVLDKALLRGGRFSRQICVPIPSTPDERKEVIQMYSKNKKFDESVNIDMLSKITIGFCPADIKSLLNDSAIISVKEKKEFIDKECIDKAFYQLIMKGNAKENSSKRNKEEIKLIAWHESGHALLGSLLGREVTKVTIIPSTTGAGGVTFYGQTKLGLFSKEELEAHVKSSYGGRIAEYLLLGDYNKVTTGASEDIKGATKTIKEMIVNYGMGTNEDLVLNLDELDVKEESILKEAKEMSRKYYNEALEILDKNKALLSKIADFLIEKETISGEELNSIIQYYKAQNNTRE